jgi:hypothetical protein
MPELERLLTQLGRDLDYPPTPDLAAAVAARLRGVEPGSAGAEAAPPAPAEAAPPRPAEAARPPVAAPTRRRLRLLPPAGLRRALVLAVVALLLLAGTVLAAVPGARDAVLEFFGLQGATVERTATLPTPPAEQRLDLGRRTTLDDARARLAFEPLVPSELGDPDFVYLREGVEGGELSLAYRPAPGLPRARTTRLGLLMSEFRGDIHPDLVGKLAGPGTRIEQLRIDGRPAIWIEGAQHFFFYRDPDGNVVEGELRLAQNVLLLERGRLLVRFEGALDRERAIAIARSLR